MRRSWFLAAALLITLLGGLLRLDAYAGKYGTLEHPAWARGLTRDVAPLARHLRPAGVAWGREARPYVGGDPFSYLKYAREMTSFYQPHVREPVFLATTRLGLWLLDDQDAGVSLASAAASVIAIFATCLLGAALISPLGGLIAGALMAVEYDAIGLAVDGWRDDTFAAAFILSICALLRFRKQPLFGTALLVGLATGAACLTRITSITFVVPGLAWVVLSGGGSVRERLTHGATAVLIATALVAPFLISCALSTGDPLFSINAHTTYYRFAEGAASRAPMSATEYIRAKAASHPVATLDVGLTGLFVRPFVRKWSPFDIWIRGLSTALSWSALAGLVLWTFTPAGRLMLVLLAASLLPYAFTWNIGSGGDFRFTLYAYPVFIVAGVYAWSSVVAAARHRRAMRPLVLRASAVAVIALVLTAAYAALPWWTASETVGRNEALTIEADERSRVFYRQGWSASRLEGNVNVRVSRVPQATVHVPLPVKRAYEIVLRFDPVAPPLQERVTVLLNRQMLGTLRLSWDPGRVGAYRLSLPEAWVRAGDNEITLVPERLVPAATAGPMFTWLKDDESLGVRMWYLRVLD